MRAGPMLCKEGCLTFCLSLGSRPLYVQGHIETSIARAQLLGIACGLQLAVLVACAVVLPSSAVAKTPLGEQLHLELSSS